MKPNRTRSLLIFLVLLIVGGGVLGYVNRTQIRDWVYLTTQPELPEEVTFEAIRADVRPEIVSETEEPENALTDVIPIAEDVTTSSEEGEAPQPPKEAIAAEALLAVPFMSQAPHANWELPYQEACEEASVLMVAGYYRGERGAYTADTADELLLDLLNFAERKGYSVDTTAEETAEIVEAYYADLEAEVVPFKNADQIKRYLQEGYPVIVPADGKALPNPNFRNGGPRYHMLVIRGYTEDRFITNDPGTRNGETFLYTYDGLLNAIHDWNNGDVPNGDPVLLILKPRIE
ncbi:hypothetical protein GF380_05740 [Candidatus Uhrbacteria bacterium]|nr:hypothetical protein [Candidatus Uhrbacteria bacterium]MBD3284503.1 hypothetical protein [Candidatus Uhrbacteria bacterium]